MEMYGQEELGKGHPDQHAPSLWETIMRKDATASKEDRNSRQRAGGIMRNNGEGIGDEYMIQQRLGGKRHLRRRAERLTNKLRLEKVARSSVRWQVDKRPNVDYQTSNMAEGGRREQHVQEGGRRNIRGEPKQIKVEDDSSEEKEPETGKGKGQIGGTFEAGQSSRGRTAKRGTRRRSRGRGRPRQVPQCAPETQAGNQQKRGRRSME